MRTSTDSSNSNRRRSSVSSQRFDDEGNAYNAATTIALFGATGATGHHFLRLAVDAGYQVCALIQAGHAANIKSFLDQPCVTFVTGALTDEYKMQQTVEGADYVVVMLGDTLPTKKEYPAGCLTDFMQQLYPILKKEPTVSVLLYQVRALLVWKEIDTLLRLLEVCISLTSSCVLFCPFSGNVAGGGCYWQHSHIFQGLENVCAPTKSLFARPRCRGATRGKTTRTPGLCCYGRKGKRHGYQ